MVYGRGIVKTVGWAGTLASIAGSFLVALQFMVVGYVCFLVGSIAWLVIGIHRGDRPLVVLNGAFLLANLIGFYNVA